MPPIAQPLPRWEQGRVIAGRYRLLRPLGSGGSAHVWAARDESLGREVALKALSGSTAQGGRERERFEREARLLAALDDPRITTVFDFAETIEQDGTTHPFLVTELLDGQILSARLKLGPLPSQEALTVCARMAHALAAAHRAGVVHRDLKPGNVMLTERGAMLLDFGISRRATDADLTGKVLIGTPACMAPEQWRGNTAQPASDLYALGCLLYWCLSGHAPYHERELPALGLAHLLADPPDLPLTGPHRAAVDEIYQACMRKDPAERPSADDVAALLDVQAQSPTVETADTMTRTQPLSQVRAHRRTLLAAYVATVGAVLAASIAVPLTQNDASPAGSGAPPRPATSGAPAGPGQAATTSAVPTPGGGSAVNAAQTNSRNAPSSGPAATQAEGGKHKPKHGKGAD